MATAGRWACPASSIAKITFGVMKTFPKVISVMSPSFLDLGLVVGFIDEAGALEQGPPRSARRAQAGKSV